MDLRLTICAVMAVLSVAGPAGAACTVSSDAGAVVRRVDPGVQGDADIIISMSMMPKLMHLDYAAAVRKAPSCDLGQIDAATGSWELYGEDGPGRQRAAIPSRKGAPVAMILPVTDILKALAAAKERQAATTDGYLLATMTKTEFVGWRYYSGMPDAATLKADMAAALGGDGTPIFRNGADGKTSIFVPKG